MSRSSDIGDESLKSWRRLMPWAAWRRRSKRMSMNSGRGYLNSTRSGIPEYSSETESSTPERSIIRPSPTSVCLERKGQTRKRSQPTTPKKSSLNNNSKKRCLSSPNLKCWGRSSSKITIELSMRSCDQNLRAISSWRICISSRCSSREES